MLIPFLAFFEKFKYVTTATLTPKRNTVPPSLGLGTHCAKVQNYEQSKIGLQFSYMKNQNYQL